MKCFVLALCLTASVFAVDECPHVDYAELKDMSTTNLESLYCEYKDTYRDLQSQVSLSMAYGRPDLGTMKQSTQCSH
jgi:hypothetical protein